MINHSQLWILFFSHVGTLVPVMKKTSRTTEEKALTEKNFKRDKSRGNIEKVVERFAVFDTASINRVMPPILRLNELSKDVDEEEYVYFLFWCTYRLHFVQFITQTNKCTRLFIWTYQTTNSTFYYHFIDFVVQQRSRVQFKLLLLVSCNFNNFVTWATPTVPLIMLLVAPYSRSVLRNEAALYEGCSFISFCAKILFWSLYLIRSGSKNFDQKHFSLLLSSLVVWVRTDRLSSPTLLERIWRYVSNLPRACADVTMIALSLAETVRSTSIARLAS